MNRVGKFIIFFVTSIFLSTIFYSCTVNYILPKIEYNNRVSFKLAYLNYDDYLIVAFKENVADRTHSLGRNSIQKSNYLNDYNLELPYQYNPSLFFLFGESHPVDIAIADINVNGKPVEVSKIIDGFHEIGYETALNGSVVYAHNKEGVTLGALDIYKMSDAFVHISSEELAKYNEQDQYLRLMYFISLLVLVSFLFHLFCKIAKRYWSTGFIIGYTVAIYFVLFLLSLILVNGNISFTDNLDTVSYIIKNYFFIILLPLIVYVCTCKCRFAYRLAGCILVFAFLFFIGIDHFVQNVFGTRFLFGYVSKFAGNIKDGVPFVLSYISTLSGLYFVLMILVAVALFAAKVSNDQNLKVSYSVLGILFVASFSAMFLGNADDKFRSFNTFQVNINGLFTDGDYQREYVDYKPYSIDQLEYKEREGLNLKKNVIVVLVESLGCNNTYLCGHDKNYSPYTMELAQNNIWFSNYYSNAFHTNGAIFALTTGYTMVASKNSENTPYNRELYQYDLINEFKKNGYKTAYFSPASQILGKDKQLKMSDYDYISFNSDEFYNNSKKDGVFFSANDEELFAKIVHDLKLSKEPVFFMTTTISTHTPYIVPWGSHSIEKAYAYSDMALKNFIKNLENIHYFDNGIVVITGDHVGWASNNYVDLSSVDSLMELHKVPLIVINGNDHGVVIDDVSFSHTSLGVMLEYLMLPKYYQNKYQINPLVDSNSNEYVFHYDDQKINTVNIKYGSKEDEILLDGDQTRFLGNDFTNDEKELALGYLSWIRR